MTKILIENTLEDTTPEIVARLFAGMGAEEQAAFFNHVARIASTWAAGSMCFQLQHITDDDGLTLAGRRVMQEIGEYSHWGLVPNAATAGTDCNPGPPA